MDFFLNRHLRDPDYPIGEISIFFRKFAKIFAIRDATRESPTPVANFKRFIDTKRIAVLIFFIYIITELVERKWVTS